MAPDPRIPVGGPNDPDNPQSPRNKPSRPTPRAQPVRGGLGPSGMPTGARPTDPAYDAWWAEHSEWIQPIEAVNPGREAEVRAVAWKYRFDESGDALIDAFSRGGFNLLGASSSGGGRGGGGGGGGGGASKDQQYAQAKASLANEAATLGLQLDDAALNSLAKVVVDSNWSADMVSDYLVPGAMTTTSAGSITAGVDAIKKMASDQVLSISDATAREWSAKLASGETTIDGVRSMLQAQATARYAWAAPQIAQGVTVRDLLLPSRDRIAQELEMNAEQIDLMDSKWLSMVQTTDDKGNTRAATDSEVVMRVRKQPEWTNTRSAAATMSGVTSMLRDYFGG